MSTFPTFEESVENAQPIELYDFGLADEQFNYTSGEEELTIDAITYTPVEISRNNIMFGVEHRQDIITITVPSSLDPAERFIAIVPGQKLTLTIRRFHTTDTAEETVVIFKGIVRSVAFTEDTEKAEFSVAALTSGQGREVPRMTYQGLCNHVLYDERCKIAQASFQFTGAVSVVDENRLTVPGLTAAGSGFYTGGFVQLGTTDYRMILAHTDDIITLLVPFPGNVLGATVNVFAGCDHTISECKTKFDNVENYGGFAFVPRKNPFNTGID